MATETVDPTKIRIPLTLAGQDYSLGVSQKSLVQMEENFGCTIMDVARRVGTGSYGITDAIAIVITGMCAEDDRMALHLFKRNEIGNALLRAGLTSVGVRKALSDWVYVAVTGRAPEGFDTSIASQPAVD